jgi:hypothetical protein
MVAGYATFQLSIGYHFLTFMQIGSGTTTTSWFGSTTSNRIQAGLEAVAKA